MLSASLLEQPPGSNESRAASARWGASTRVRREDRRDPPMPLVQPTDELARDRRLRLAAQAAERELALGTLPRAALRGSPVRIRSAGSRVHQRSQAADSASVGYQALAAVALP